MNLGTVILPKGHLPKHYLCGEGDGYGDGWGDGNGNGDGNGYCGNSLDSYNPGDGYGNGNHGRNGDGYCNKNHQPPAWLRFESYLKDLKKKGKK